MNNNEYFDNIKNNILNSYQSKTEKLKELKKRLLESQKSNDTRKIEFYSKQTESILSSINNIKSQLSCMRPNNNDDLNERHDIMVNFPKLVNETIPDDVPMVFHGNNNIEIVKQIISSGGLYTPEERGVDFKSFATQIDVTYKSNIRVSCEFADSSTISFMPYGAIFAFYPKEHEYEKVLKTGENSEVFGGVESIDFKDDRFVGIITTNENLETLKLCFDTNQLDSNKVFTHKQFINFCKEKWICDTKITK